MRWVDGITNSVDMSEQTPGNCERQGGLACCSPQSRKESDTTQRLNNNKGKINKQLSKTLFIYFLLPNQWQFPHQNLEVGIHSTGCPKEVRTSAREKEKTPGQKQKHSNQLFHFKMLKQLQPKETNAFRMRTDYRRKKRCFTYLGV